MLWVQPLGVHRSAHCHRLGTALLLSSLHLTRILITLKFVVLGYFKNQYVILYVQSDTLCIYCHLVLYMQSVLVI